MSEGQPDAKPEKTEKAEVAEKAEATKKPEEAGKAVMSDADGQASNQSDGLDSSDRSGQIDQPRESNQAEGGAQGPDQTQAPKRTLTAEYEILRHSTDSAVLSSMARQPLPPKSDQAAYSRQTALLEAVAGNLHTPIHDRIYLAETMPFPNVLVKLQSDPEPEVRKAVAANKADKNWLVGLLTKDENQDVRTAALTNPRTSWKMRLEGAQDADTSVEALEFLAQLGVSIEPDANPILSAMVRHAVALNPSTPQALVEKLAEDKDANVVRAVRRRLDEHQTESLKTPLPVQSVPGHGKIGQRAYPKGFVPIP